MPYAVRSDAMQGGDPFNNDPFASSSVPVAQPRPAPQAPPAPAAYNAPSDMYNAAPADPFASLPQAPAPQPRAATIGPNHLQFGQLTGAPLNSGTIGPSKSNWQGGAPIAPAAPIAPQGDPWGSAPRIEPEIEESQTRVVPALGSARPKLLITQLDGTEEGEFPLKDGENVIGRETGGIFAKDNLLSGRHATLIVQGPSVWVRDENSRNGVYVRIPRQQHVELSNGDQFCIGRIILRFELQPTADAIGLLHLVVGRDVDKTSFPCRVPLTGLTLGRNRAELRFPNDGWVSGLHCQIVVHGPQVMLVDLGSSNGTYQRIRGVRALAHHDAILMGQRIFHVHNP